MPPKTIYVRDNTVWDRARTLAGEEGLSGVIAELLSDWVERKDALQAGSGELSEIELWVGGTWYEEQYGVELPHHVAFTGRRIATSEGLSLEQTPRLSIYETRTGKLIVYRDWSHAPGSESGATYTRYSNFAGLKRDPTALRTLWLDEIDETKEFVERSDLEQLLLREVSEALGEKFVIRID